MVNGTLLPAYRGDNVNSDEPTIEARTPNPKLMLKAYHQCTQTINILRAFSTGGYPTFSLSLVCLAISPNILVVYIIKHFVFVFCL